VPRGDHTPASPPPSWIPDDEISQAAYQYAATHLHPTILNHSLRVLLYAALIAFAEGAPYRVHSSIESTVLLVTALFHDIGTSQLHDAGPTRFEIESADAAKLFLLRFPDEVSQEWIQHVWTAIAVHTSPQIAERIHPLARLLRLAVKVDFGGAEEMEVFYALTQRETGDKIIAGAQESFPRGEIEKVLGDVVVAQALRTEGKAPMVSWPGVLLRSKLENPEWEGVNKAF
jgi:hypothetical protein